MMRCEDCGQKECCGADPMKAAADDLYEALQLARESIAAFPKSMGYDITHLRVIDAALTKARGERNE